MDWLLYHNEVKNSASLQDGSTTLKGKLEDCAKAILEVACKHIGKTKPNRSGKNFVTPTLRKEIKLQNKLKKELPQKKEELIQTCKKVQESMRGSRRKLEGFTILYYMTVKEEYGTS